MSHPHFFLYVTHRHFIFLGAGGYFISPPTHPYLPYVAPHFSHISPFILRRGAHLACGAAITDSRGRLNELYLQAQAVEQVCVNQVLKEKSSHYSSRTPICLHLPHHPILSHIYTTGCMLEKRPKKTKSLPLSPTVFFREAKISLPHQSSSSPHMSHAPIPPSPSN